MNQIADIIQNVFKGTVLHQDGMLSEGAQRDIAERCANKLVGASLEQLAELLGGSVEVDNDGRAIVYTDYVVGS